MLRCPGCGRRVSDADPRCPVHGALEDEPLRVAHARRSSAPLPDDALDLRADSAFGGLGYTISGVLGRGGFGIVYRAVRQRDLQTVAIKVALREHRDAEKRLVREAAALEAVGPPHVPAVHARGSLVGLFYVVLEHIAAPTLAERMVSEPRPMTLPRFAELAAALLRPVEATHARGIAHRDLKPENVFLDDQGSARLIDFGSARDRSDPAELSVGDDVGTAEYMSPEQCDGLADADPRSDIYSLGVVLYELLSGAPPFWGKTADVREAQRSQRPAPLWASMECPRELDAVIRRCLAKDRSRRFESVASLRAALDIALTAHRPPDASPWQALTSIADVPPALRPPPRRPSAPAREKRTVGLVFFESRAGIGGIQPVIAASGGQLVQTSGAQHVAAFGHDVGENPARMALLAAQKLLAGKLTGRALVEVASVTVQMRPDGSRRVFSPLFAKKDVFPAPPDPAGVTLTSAALDVLPHLRTTPVDGRADRFVLVQAPTREPTTFGVQMMPLVGRDELLRELTDSARRAAQNEPTLFTVSGEPGLGRTYLASVLAQQLERLPMPLEVLKLAAQPQLIGAVSQTLPELLRHVLRLPAEAPADGGRALLSEALGPTGEQVWAAAALALGWIDAEHPDVQRIAAAPGALRVAAARAAGEGLRRRARERPVVLLLDDAHLADDATLDALEYATLQEARAPVFCCALVLPSFERVRPTWGLRAAQRTKRTLAPLEQAQAMELARRLLLPVEHVPPVALARLADRTQGVPRLMVELVRGLKRDGLVRRSERGLGYFLATDELEKLPDLPIVQWNARREYEALSTELAGHARVASVLGQGFTVHELEELLAVLERDEALDDIPLDASVGVQRLIDAGLLVRHRSDAIDFRHALLRDTIYQLLSEGRRTRLHRGALEMYQTLAMPSERRLPRLALHASRSGEREAASAAYLELAERALSAQAYLEAEAAFGGALENLSEDDGRMVAAGRGRGLMRFRLGRHEDALKDLRRARVRAHQAGRSECEAELTLDEATVLDWTRDFAVSAALVGEAETLCATPSPLLSARLAMSRARMHHRKGHADECVRLGAEAASAAEALGDPGYETRVISLLMVAPDCATLGRFDEAARYFDAAIDAAEQHADLHHLGATILNRVTLWYAQGDVERLFADCGRALQVAREIGLAFIEYATLCNMAEVEYALDRLDRAVEHSERAIELARQLWGAASLEVGTRELLLARIALHREDLTEATQLAACIRARLARQREQASAEEIELSPFDRLLLEMVELGARNAPDAEWAQLVAASETLGVQPYEALELLEMRARAALRRGEPGKELLAQAVALAEQSKSLLSERVLRRAHLLAR